MSGPFFISILVSKVGLVNREWGESGGQAGQGVYLFFIRRPVQQKKRVLSFFLFSFFSFFFFLDDPYTEMSRGGVSHKKFQVTVNFEKYSSRVSLGLLAYDYSRRLVGRIESWQRTGF